jgi:hypothetical protein
VGAEARPQEAARKKERKQQKRENHEKECEANEVEKRKGWMRSTLSGFSTWADSCSPVLDARALSQASRVEKMRDYLPEESIRRQE